jgi:hypothetical protein
MSGQTSWGGSHSAAPIIIRSAPQPQSSVKPTECKWQPVPVPPQCRFQQSSCNFVADSGAKSVMITHSKRELWLQIATILLLLAILLVVSVKGHAQQANFPPVTSGGGSGIPYGTGGGTAQAQTVTTTPNITALTTGTYVTWLPTAANTAAAPTLAAGTTAATTITKCGTVALVPGDLLSTVWAVAQYDGTEWVLQNPVQFGCSEGGLPTTGGTANAPTLTVAPAITAYSPGMVFNFTNGAANTGATTIAISGLAAKNVTKCGTTALVANDLTVAATAVILYDGTEFQLLNPQATGCGAAAINNMIVPRDVNWAMAGINEFSNGITLMGSLDNGNGAGTLNFNAGNIDANGIAYATVSTGTTANTQQGYAPVVKPLIVGKSPSFKIAFGLGTTSSVQAWVGVASFNNVSNAGHIDLGPQGVAFIGFRYFAGTDTNWQCYQSDLSHAGQVVDSTIPPDITNLQTFDVIVSASNVYTFYINGVQRCQFTPTNLPVGTTNLSAGYVAWQNTTTTSVTVKVGRLYGGSN